HILLRTPSPPPRSTLFPYTTLFRSQGKSAEVDRVLEMRLAQPLVLLRADEDDERALPRGAGRDRRRRTQADRRAQRRRGLDLRVDRKSTRLNSSHRTISYAVFCLKK